MSDPTAQEQQRKYVKRRSESGMKKRLIAALLTAGLLFSFGTTAFAEVSDEQTLDTDSAGSIVTQDSTGQKDEGIVLLDDVVTYAATYTVIYNYNDDKTPSVSVDVEEGKEIKITQADPSRKDYIFKGWQVNGEGKAYQLNDVVIQNASANITLVAQWEADKRHFGYYLSDPNAKWENDVYPNDVERYTDGDKTKYRETRIVKRGEKLLLPTRFRY